MKVKFPIISIISIAACFLSTGQTLHGSESDDLWAEALLLAQRDFKAPTKEVDELFSRAIKKAIKKGPIYISQGNYYARLEHNGYTPKSASEKRSLHYYFAATRKDKKLTTAWFKIAINPKTSNQLKKKAIFQFIMWDNRNALPVYMEALSFLNTKQPGPALLTIRRGNRKSLKMPPTHFPKDFSVKYPNTDSHKKAGLAGKELRPSHLEYFYHLDNWRDTSKTTVRMGDLAKMLIAKAESLRTEGRTDEAIHYLESLGTLGINISQTTNSDLFFTLVGLRFAGQASKALRPIYEASGKKDKIAKLDIFDKAKKTYHAECIEHARSTRKVFEAMMKEDLLTQAESYLKHTKDENNFHRKLRKETGLDTFSFEK